VSVRAAPGNPPARPEPSTAPSTVVPPESAEQHRLWGGRFTTPPAAALDALNRSIATDLRLWPHDVRLSKAWASALAAGGVLTADDAATIRHGLDAVGTRIAAGEQPVASDEDVHTFIDRLLHDEIGDPASRLHTGRSRNDQVATATRLWTMDAAASLDGAVRTLQETILAHAERLRSAIMPAYTHLQRAQPVSAAHWMLAHFWALARDRVRIAAARDAASVLPLGSGAIAGCAFPVPREQLRDELGFASLSPNSIDATGDRDFVADLLFSLTLLATHVSRLAEDMILFGTSEFGFVTFSDRFSTGSSMMPQKRNPDVFEIARGAPGRALGDLTAVLVSLKGLPTGYNKDLQDDKRPLFDAVDTALLVLPAVAGALSEITFNTDRMRAACSASMMATDLADYLVGKGVSFREAHAVVGALVRESETQSVDLAQLPFSRLASAHPAFSADVSGWLSPEASVSRRNVPGGTGPAAVDAQLASAREAL